MKKEEGIVIFQVSQECLCGLLKEIVPHLLKLVKTITRLLI